MMTALLFLVLIMAVLHALLEGKREAMFYHLMSNPDWHYSRKDLPWKHDEHDDYMGQRIIVFLAFSASVPSMNFPDKVGAIIIASIAIIWFVLHVESLNIHEAIYNPLLPLKLWKDNVYEGDEPRTFNLPGRIRKWLLIVGLLMFVSAVVLVNIL